ncbi:MAG: FecR domain-containing protein, partial [Deltaproteobacteria bacterium]|nr:FecR domain-containing protein [Deltaproteobacteria bacterium]
MTDILHNSEQLSCESTKLLLEKRVAEDVLSPEEEQLYNEHLSSCEKCRNLSILTFGLSKFADDPVDENEFDGAILKVMETLESNRQKENSRKIMWTGIGVAIAAVMLVGVWSLLNINDISNASKPAFQCTPSAPVELAEGVFMTTCDDSEPGTIIEDGVVRVSLNEGAVALSVNPARPNKKQVSVITPDGEVRVKGTLFAVHVDNNDARVEVFRGIVEVIHTGDNNRDFDVKA